LQLQDFTIDISHTEASRQVDLCSFFLLSLELVPYKEGLSGGLPITENTIATQIQNTTFTPPITMDFGGHMSDGLPHPPTFQPITRKFLIWQNTQNYDSSIDLIPWSPYYWPLHCTGLVACPT
jgi:hypothetical protein